MMKDEFHPIGITWNCNQFGRICQIPRRSAGYAYAPVCTCTQPIYRMSAYPWKCQVPQEEGLSSASVLLSTRRMLPQMGQGMR